MKSSVTAVSGLPAPLWRRAFDWWLVQVKHVLPPTIFFFFGFNLILFTRWATLQEQGIPFTNFYAATLLALLVGKAVLVVDNLRFMHRFDGAPLMQPILFKSAIYWLCVFVLRLAEALWDFSRGGGTLGDFPNFLVAQFSWPRFLVIQIWLMVLFLVYVTAHELNTLFGDGELPRLFLRWHSSEAKLPRRQRTPSWWGSCASLRHGPARSRIPEWSKRTHGARPARTAAMEIQALRLVVAGSSSA